MDDANVLQVEHLNAQFDVGRRKVFAVNDVSFSLKRGTSLGIVGESGCGKSVTAHSIVQLLPKAGKICKGSIIYAPKPGVEQVLTNYSSKSREIRAIRGEHIAMIFQDPLSSLDPVYSIGRQIEESLLQHVGLTKKEAKKRIIELLGKLGIPSPAERYNDYPHQFSGGMKQRVMIAIAMICNPKILIADEPTTALDVTIQAQILSLMKQIQKDFGTSIILITHNMGIVAETCDDVAVMYMGRIVESGTLEQVFNNPLHPYTKALLRSVPVLGMDKDCELESIRGSTPDGSEVFTGCEFEPRCDFVMERCRHEHPPALDRGNAHEVRCWLFEKEHR